ncbi:Protein of unknown function [Prevotellaceae bacterium MN60]|nr:Protein of unknown function [Prevotellaceae bacterium MN60]
MRPILTREEYLQLRDSERQRITVQAVRNGMEEQKKNLLQMNYSCLPNEDGTLKGAKAMSTTVGMDIDHIAPEELPRVKERILGKKDELGLLMLEKSARGQGYHLVFRRKTELSQEENLKWASELLGVKYDDGAKDITRVFFTTTNEELLFLDDAIFEMEEARGNGGTEVRGYENTSSAETFLAPPASIEADPRTPEPPKEELRFKGIPYSSIIAEYWRRTGGEPAEGERNVKLHKLAVNLRAICDNKKEVLMKVMPRYGLTEQELQSIVDSACKEPTKGSKIMEAIVTSPNLPEGEEMEEECEQAFQHPLLRRGLGRLLPLGLKESLTGVPVSMHMPVLCGILPIAAAYADQVEVEYCDGNRQRLGLMSIIRGEQASGKSVVKGALDIWKRQFDEEDTLARKREDEWKERKKGRKANEKAPEDPKVLIRMVPVTVSCSTLLKRFKNAQGHTLYSFGEELDTLRKTNGAGSWSSKYDIYRLAFDQGEWGQDYNSDAAESGVVKVAYNWTMLGTNGALKKCFRADNIENGLSSRILVAEMPDSSFSKMPKFKHRSTEDEGKILEAVTRLRSYSGYVDTPRLRKAIEEWVEEKRVEAAKDIDHVKDTYRKRAAVIGFRCGVVYRLLDGKESNRCLEFAVMMAEYCLQQQMSAFGEALRTECVNAREECQRYGSNHSVFDQLSPTFTMDDLRALKRNFCSDAALRKIVSRWYHDGWIEKSDTKHWRKISVTL